MVSNDGLGAMGSTVGDEKHPALGVNFLLGFPVQVRGPSYTAVKIAEALQAQGLERRIFGHPNLWPDQLDVPIITRPTYPGERLLARMPNPHGMRLLHRTAGRHLFRWLKKYGCDHQAVYLWGEVELDITRRIKKLAVPIIREKINCAKMIARELLDVAYSEIGAEQPRRMSDRLISKEMEEIKIADAVFCPSPMVRKSLLEVGVPAEKLISTSYGWDPKRFAGTDKALPDHDGPTFLFVGDICVRKGAHILLDAWKKAGEPGRLILLGNIEPFIATRYEHVLNLPTVQHMKFTLNVGAIFRSADWFVFPSLEEGGPQVTYEAAGCGLPGIVSPMGAGAFTRDRVDGEILPSLDAETWAEALVRLGPDEDLRAQWSKNAQSHAAEFTWEKVGARRAVDLMQRFG